MMKQNKIPEIWILAIEGAEIPITITTLIKISLIDVKKDMKEKEIKENQKKNT